MINQKWFLLKKDGGSELWIQNNDKYCGKILRINKGKKFSIHFHKEKEETFFLSKGKIELRWTDNYDPNNFNLDNFISSLTIEFLNPGDAFHLPPGRIHQIYALEDSEIIEFSTHHKDEDSFRILKGD